MPRPVPRASEIGPCPLRTPADSPAKHLVWKDASGWVVVYGTPEVWTLITAGLPCFHMAADASRTRRLTFWDGGPGRSTPTFRANRGLGLPDGQQVCDICWGDLTGGAR